MARIGTAAPASGPDGTQPANGSTETPWRLPPQAMAWLIDQPPFPALFLSPTRDHLALARRPGHPAIAELARRELRLAGLRIDPDRHDRSRREPFTRVTLSALASLKEREIEGFPSSPRLDYIGFSPDGAHLSLTHRGDSGLELWVVELRTARARRLGPPLSAVAGAPYRWMPDGRAVIALCPKATERPPVEPEVPPGPVVLTNDRRQAPARTFRDLLTGPHDEALFEHYMTTALLRVELDGTTRVIGAPDMYASVSPSPDGRYLLVETLRRPFSYRVPAARFPSRIDVRAAGGEPVATISELLLADAVPVTFGSVRQGRRWVGWRADAGAELAFVEAQDGGDAGRTAAIRDRVYLLDEPFHGAPRELVSLSTRFGGIVWGTDEVALVTEWWWSDRRARTWIVAPSAASAGGEPPPRLLHDRDWEDRYRAPGTPVTVPTPCGRSVLLVDDGKLFFVGPGASPDGDHPFLDTLDLSSLASSRLWQSAPPGYRCPVAILDPATLTVLMRRESPDDPPNYSVASLRRGAPEAPKPVTAFTHPAPELRLATKELLRYTRRDGVGLSGTLHLPPGYEAARDGPLPLLIWAYPRPYKNTGTAAQVRAAPHRWEPISWASPLLWLAERIAVLDDPSMPIIGEGNAEPNDTYVEQLVMNAEAAVEAVVERGVAERGRIAVGGHSYGAFMTVHLLAHTSLFCAGIARSGSYNRSLTPFGFQSEERVFWAAPEVYRAMSAFDVADRVEAPLLLVHGRADENAGTHPEQSERLFDALKGLGATVRLVLLPLEGHGYRARESVMHVLWEMTEWLRVHLVSRL